MRWQNIDLVSSKVAVAPLGGPIGQCYGLECVQSTEFFVFVLKFGFSLTESYFGIQIMIIKRKKFV